MAAFDFARRWDGADPDLPLLIRGGVVLYHSNAVLQQAIAELEAIDYQFVRLDCQDWDSPEAFHRSVASALQFPDYYGENLNAFNDCLRDLEVPDPGGLALVFHRFDVFHALDADAADGALDILNLHTRTQALYGRRLLTLVQTDDPTLKIGPFRGDSAAWNDREWLTVARG